MPRPKAGEPSAIKQVYPKTGGVIMLYDFLNSPAANSLAVVCFIKQGVKENEKEISHITGVDFNNTTRQRHKYLYR